MTTLTQAALDLVPVVSSGSALYELLNGRAAATDEEVSRFMAGIGLVPVVGGVVKQGGKALSAFAAVDKAVDVGKVAQSSERAGDALAQHGRLRGRVN